MSSSAMNNDGDRIIANAAYKPGYCRYQDVSTDKRKNLFEDRQNELNPCLKVG